MTDIDPDQLTNLAFLEQALASSIPFGAYGRTNGATGPEGGEVSLASGDLKFEIDDPSMNSAIED